MSTFGELLYPIYYTAAVNGNSMDGQVSDQVVRSNSLRQVMRSAARFNTQSPEAEISVYRHNGGGPKLVAKRQVARRYWRYLERGITE
jgi:hypothetical protein